MTAAPKSPNTQDNELAGYGKSIIIVPLILGGAVIVCLIMLWKTHDRNVRLAEMTRREEAARVLLRSAYADMRALRPEAALDKTAQASQQLSAIKKNWPSDYAELRVAALLMEAEALLMQDSRANATRSEESFSQALALMPYSSGELWQFGYLGRARARLEAEKYPEAIADLDHVMTRNPNYGAAYYWRALARQLVGDDKGAAEDEERAKSLDSWPPLRDFMQASSVHVRDILCKPGATSCEVITLPGSGEHSLMRLFSPDNDGQYVAPSQEE